jgi:AAA+ ATPase superfamily predicted ATPase
MFIDRTKELLFLENMSRREGLKLLFLSGRPGIGKTELLTHFIGNKTAFFYSSGFSSSQGQLTRFKERAFYVSNSRFFRSKKNNSWDVVLKYVFETMAIKIPLIIIDEFPVLCESVRTMWDLLERNCKEFGKKRDLFIILSGSDCGSMEGEYLNRTWGDPNAVVEFMELEPLKFEQAASFYPDFSAHKKVYTYAILGGKPAYLQRFNRMKTVEQNVKKEILDKDSFLYREPLFLLLKELREPFLYFAILRAIALNNNRVNDIVEETGFRDVHMVNKYLYVLRKLYIIKRICPITDPDPEVSRKGMYVFNDSFFRFWFRFIIPNLSFLEMSDTAYVWRQMILPDLDDFTRVTFKEICIQRLKRYNKYQKLPFAAEKIGSWWDRQTALDAVAFNNSGSCLFCSCMWTEKKLGVESLQKLRKKAERFPGAKEKYYGLFSKMGFSPELKMYAKEHEEVLLLPYY